MQTFWKVVDVANTLYSLPTSSVLNTQATVKFMIDRLIDAMHTSFSLSTIVPVIIAVASAYMVFFRCFIETLVFKRQIETHFLKIKSFNP